MKNVQRSTWTRSRSLLHHCRPAVWDEEGHGARLHRSRMDLDARAHACASTSIISDTREDHGQARSAEARRRSTSMSGAPGTTPEPGREPGLPLPAEHAARRAGRGAQLQHLPPPRRPRAHDQHRADGQRAAGHDPHRRAEDAARRPPTTCSRCTCRSRARRFCRRRSTLPNTSSANYSVPAVSVSAARDTEGRLHLALVNLDPNREAVVTTTVEWREGERRRRPRAHLEDHGRAQHAGCIQRRSLRENQRHAQGRGAGAAPAAEIRERREAAVADAGIEPGRGRGCRHGGRDQARAREHEAGRVRASHRCPWSTRRLTIPAMRRSWVEDPRLESCRPGGRRGRSRRHGRCRLPDAVRRQESCPPRHVRDGRAPVRAASPCRESQCGPGVCVCVS